MCPHDKDSCQQVKEVMVPLYSALVEASLGVLCSVLGSPVQKSCGLTRESPAKGHKGDEGARVSLDEERLSKLELFRLE